MRGILLSGFEVSTALAAMDAARKAAPPGHFMTKYFESLYARLKKCQDANREAGT